MLSGRRSPCQRTEQTGLAHRGEGMEGITPLKPRGGSCKGRQSMLFCSHVTELARGSGLVHRTAGSCGDKAGELRTVCLRQSRGSFQRRRRLPGRSGLGTAAPSPGSEGRAPPCSATPKPAFVQCTTRLVVLKPGLRNSGSSPRTHQLTPRLPAQPPGTSWPPAPNASRLCQPLRRAGARLSFPGCARAPQQARL